MASFDEIKDIIQTKADSYYIYYTSYLERLFNNINFNKKSIKVCKSSEESCIVTVKATLPDGLHKEIIIRFFSAGNLDGNYQYLTLVNCEISFTHGKEVFTLYGIHADSKPSCIVNVDMISDDIDTNKPSVIPYPRDYHFILRCSNYSEKSNIISEAISTYRNPPQYPQRKYSKYYK